MAHTTIDQPLAGITSSDGRYGSYNLGAHAFAWQPAGQQHPVLWMSASSSYQVGEPVRGGVPVIFP